MGRLPHHRVGGRFQRYKQPSFLPAPGPCRLAHDWPGSASPTSWTALDYLWHLDERRILVESCTTSRPSEQILSYWCAREALPCTYGQLRQQQHG